MVSLTPMRELNLLDEVLKDLTVILAGAAKRPASA